MKPTRQTMFDTQENDQRVGSIRPLINNFERMKYMLTFTTVLLSVMGWSTNTHNFHAQLQYLESDVTINDSLLRMAFFNRIESYTEAEAVMARTRPYIHPDTAFSYYFISAQTATGLMAHDSAVVRYQRAFEIDSTRNLVKQKLAIALANNNDIPAAISMFRRIIDDDSLASTERLWMAKLYVRQDMVDSAIAVLQDRPALLQNHFKIQHAEARLMHKHGFYGKRTVDLYASLVKRKPEDRELLMEYAKTMARYNPTELLEKSDWLYQQHASADMAFIIADVHRFFEKYEGAIYYYDKAIEHAINSKIDQFYGNAAYVFEQINKPQQAIAYYEKAMSYNPEDGFYAYYAALLYDQLGNHQKAQTHFRTFLSSPAAKENQQFVEFSNDRLTLYKQAEFMKRGR
ncbi:MAG: hypothetical protein LAT54_04595 [Cryomorphaceae bacterium]|nr:hypothetical protein [Cryomorphaceae bacterium]